MKCRLDELLVHMGLVKSVGEATGVIMAGDVYVNMQKADKAGQTFDSEKDKIEVRNTKLRYVSRGGLKLEKSMEKFNLKLDGFVCADIGASTGGFTDCMLQNGAEKVYSIDVGYGQLAWELRTNPKVVNMERTNIRYVTHNEIPEDLDFVSIDVSFISLTKVLPVAYELLGKDRTLVCLIKPQFEAERDKVGKKGVVTDTATHVEVIKKVLDFSLSAGFVPLGLTFSPVKGPEGNIEYLLYLKKGEGAALVCGDDAERVVEESHSTLLK